MDLMELEKAIDTQASFLTKLRFEDLSEDTIRQAKRILLDSIGCMAVGNTQLVESDTPSGDYCLVGQGSTDKMTATFLNGAAMVKNELDEGNQFAFGHPACHIIPAFLAECQETKPTGTDAIVALIAAYEVSCRWGCSAKAKPQMHVHGTMQTVGAAAAGCKLNHCNAEETQKALVLANSLPQATTWTSAFHGDQLRNAYIGMSNLVGGNAFRMVRSGVESSVDSLASVWEEILEGSIEPEELTRGLGTQFYMEQNYFKVHAACRYTHSFADMLRECMEQGLKASEIEKIEIETYHAAAKLKGQDAENSFAMRFSIPMAMGICLVYGDLSMENVTDEAVMNPEVKKLAKRIFVAENEDFTKLLPGIRKNKMRIRLRDGHSIVKESSVTKGDFLDPFSEEEVLNKFRKLTGNVWSTARQNEIIEYVMELEKKTNFRELLALIGKEM